MRALPREDTECRDEASRLEASGERRTYSYTPSNTIGLKRQNLIGPVDPLPLLIS